MKINLPKNFVKSCALLFIAVSTSFGLKAQLTGTKTIPLDYPTIAAFVTDLNTNGVGAGGVNLVLTPGYTETAPAGGYVITATGTAANNISIGSLGMPKPVITAPVQTAGALNDAIFKIVGGDYINIAGLELRENTANLITAAGTNDMTEWGIALLYASATDGAENCSFINNTIVLNRAYQNTFGIYANATHTATAVTTSATASSPNGGFSGLKIYGNAISNVNQGIVVVGPTGAANHSNGIDIGGTGASTGNIISDYGTTGTFSGYSNVSGSVNGILVRNAINVNISYNSITSSNGGVTAGTVRGIFMPAFNNAPTGTFTNTISNNNLSVKSANASGGILGLHVDGPTTSTNSTFTINNNNFNNFGHTIVASGTVTLIQNASTIGNLSITNNMFSNISVNTTGTFYCINNNTSLPTFLIDGNSIVGSLTKTGAGGILYGYYNFGSPTSGTATISNNSFSNVTLTGATQFFGIRQYTSTSQIENITNNIVNNITGGTSQIFGISHGYGAVGSIVSGNTVSNMTSNGSISAIQIGDGSAGNAACFGNNVFGITTTSGTVIGISNVAGVLTSIYNNKVYNLESNNATGEVYGIGVSAGTTSLYNNLIADLRAPITSGTNVVRGISISSTATSSNINAYNNTVYLNASSSGTNFGTSGIFHTVSATATTASLDLRNNIIINESAAAGTGLTVAFRRSGTALNNFASTSNNNKLYAGTPSATNVILFDGTTAQQTLLNYQTLVAPRDAQAITGESFTYSTPGSFFISVTGSSTDFLKPVTGITTQVESGALAITTPINLSTDYAGTTRATFGGYTGTGTAPDRGAFEFEGVSPAPVITLNTVTPSTTTQCAAVARLVSVNVTTASGTITGSNLTYSVNGVAQTPIVMTNTVGTTWEATIPVPTPSNATIVWGVNATNSIGLVTNYSGTTYADEPLTGVTASATATATTVCAGSPTDLSATLTKSVTAQIGNGTASNSSSTSVGAFYGSFWGNGHAQILIRASELTAAGITSGNITSLSVNVSTLGSPTTLNNFTVKMAPTSATAITTFQAPVFTTVVTAANYTPVLGLNTHTFSAPFNWDGSSNIIVDYCFANGITGSTSAVNTMTTATFGSFVNYNADGAGGLGACSNTTVSNTSSNRPNLIFSGNGAPAISSISWSDGVATVGTTNPLTVNPTATTTYTATITAGGCTVAPSPSVAVTVNPLPTAPTATNSAQCGVQIPTASVTSTSGLPTPTFKWYDAATGGTVMQNSASTTYTTAVASTTTFHVAEINTTTGCESARVAITVNVSTPDAVSATPSATSICLGESVTLVAANTNPTPFQSYTYSWLSTTNSGVESATTGASIIVTPTQAGSYTYDLTGVDGGCSAVASTIVTVNLNPTSVVASANDASICLGEQVNLMVTSTTNSMLQPATVFSENFDAGLGAWTTEFNGTAPVGSAWLAQNAPYSYPSYFTNFATPQGGGFAMTNGDIGGSGLKTRTKLTSPSFSTAGMTSATLTFQNLYQKWNSGDSLVRLEISTDGGTNWATLKDYLPLGSQGVTTAFAQVPANESIALTAPYLNQANVKIRYNFVTAWGYYWVVDNVIVSGIQEGTTTYDWTSTPAGFTSSVQNPMGVAPVATTTYNVEVTNSFGCSATASTTVTVNSPSTSTTSVTECDSYTWNGTTYTTSGTYTWTGTNAVGCDSVATLNLTINNSTASTVNVTACDTYTWAQNSTTYTSSGMYNVTIANAIGCDSVITLNLTINNSTAATVNVTNCGPYTWALNSTTYTVSGVHTVTILNAANCDSVITLNLTINSPSTSTTTVTECDMYTWNGVDYTTSGTYTWMGTNAASCDSTATLVLTINNSSTSSTTVTECDMYTWNGVDYTTSGTYTWIGTNAANCDSTATLVLTITNSTTSTTTASDCDMYTWNGVDYTTSGTYTWIGTNAANCDSTATLVLTINSITATATDNGNATASASAGTSYVWINCATNQAIAGATAQTFAPTVNGSYAVVVTNAAGCSDTSNCVTISNVGIKELVDHSLNVYPNPTNGNVTIEFSAAIATIEVIDAQGKSLQTQSVSSGDIISLENYERGVYFLKINSENGSAIQRVVKN